MVGWFVVKMKSESTSCYVPDSLFRAAPTFAGVSDYLFTLWRSPSGVIGTRGWIIACGAHHLVSERSPVLFRFPGLRNGLVCVLYD